MQSPSPFVFGKTANGDFFTNREKEQKRLVSNFENNINTILISPRRWGKSSLVEKVAAKVNSKKRTVILIDLFPIKDEADFYNTYASAILKATSSKLESLVVMAKRFLKNISPKFSIGADALNDFEIELQWGEAEKNYKEILNLPERIATEKGIQIVVCIDEFQNISAFNDPLLFQKRLRSEWQHHKNVSYCLYGSRQHMMIELFERQSMPFFKFGEMIYLPKIAEEHWVTFITGAFAKTKKQISAEMCSKIANAVKLHPYYVQQLAHLVWVNTSKAVNPETWKTSLEELLNQNAILYSKETEDLSPAQLNFLKAVAMEAQGMSSKETISRFNMGTSANVSKMKETLQKREIIDVNSGKIEFIDPAYELWFKKFILKQDLFPASG